MKQVASPGGMGTSEQQMRRPQQSASRQLPPSGWHAPVSALVSDAVAESDPVAVSSVVAGAVVAGVVVAGVVVAVVVVAVVVVAVIVAGALTEDSSEALPEAVESPSSLSPQATTTTKLAAK